MQRSTRTPDPEDEEQKAVEQPPVFGKVKPFEPQAVPAPGQKRRIVLQKQPPVTKLRGSTSKRPRSTKKLEKDDEGGKVEFQEFPCFDDELIGFDDPIV